MKKIVIFDADGVVVKREMYFSQRLARDFGIPEEDIMQFFQNEFRDCAVGKADLKKALEKYKEIWGWKKSVEDLMEYWFEGEIDLNEELVNGIKNLRKRGYICCLATNNEIYRTKYLEEKVGLKNLFDFIFSSAESGYLKSQDYFWKYVQEKLGLKDGENIIVWDNDGETVEKVSELGMEGFLFVSMEDFKDKMSELFDQKEAEYNGRKLV
jgi:putative hydrolase of the HAD superfamily